MADVRELSNFLDESLSTEEKAKETIKLVNGGQKDIIQEIGNGKRGQEIAEHLKNKGINPDDLVGNRDKETSKKVIKEATNMARGDQGQKLMKDLTKSGVNVKQMQASMKREQNIMKNKLNEKQAKKTAVIVTASRKLKEITIDSELDTKKVKALLNCSDEVISFNGNKHYALGIMENKEIEIWYDPSMEKNVNRRGKKLLKFNVGGAILFCLAKGNLTVKDFETWEKQLLETKEKPMEDDSEVDKIISAVEHFSQ